MRFKLGRGREVNTKIRKCMWCYVNPWKTEYKHSKDLLGNTYEKNKVENCQGLLFYPGVIGCSETISVHHTREWESPLLFFIRDHVRTQKPRTKNGTIPMCMLLPKNSNIYTGIISLICQLPIACTCVCASWLILFFLVAVLFL